MVQLKENRRHVLLLNITVGIVVRDGPSLSESSSARHGNVVMFSQCGPLFESSRRDETGYYAVTDSTRGDIILVTWSRHYLLSALYSPIQPSSPSSSPGISPSHLHSVSDSRAVLPGFVLALRHRSLVRGQLWWSLDVIVSLDMFDARGNLDVDVEINMKSNWVKKMFWYEWDRNDRK